MCPRDVRWKVYTAHQWPPDFKQPNADSLVQVTQTERGTSEVSYVIDQDEVGFLKDTPVGHTDDSRPSAFTFANMTVQTDECTSSMTSEVPDELKQTMEAIYGWPIRNCLQGRRQMCI